MSSRNIVLACMLLTGCSAPTTPSKPNTPPPPARSERFAVVSNQLSNTISTYAIDPATGRLTSKATVPTGGTFSRVIALDPSGHFAYVANDASNDISTFAIDSATGGLTAVGAPVP